MITAQYRTSHSSYPVAVRLSYLSTAQYTAHTHSQYRTSQDRLARTLPRHPSPAPRYPSSTHVIQRLPTTCNAHS
eukprot:3941756-Rhodomonas_salina.2